MLYNHVLAIGTRMSGLYDTIVSTAEDSDYIDVEHVWPLGIGLTVVLISLLDIRALNRLLASLDGFTQLRDLLLMAVNYPSLSAFGALRVGLVRGLGL